MGLLRTGRPGCGFLTPTGQKTSRGALWARPASSVPLRRSTRVNIGCPVRISGTLANHAPFAEDAQIVTLSKFGAKLKTHLPLRVGMQLKVAAPAREEFRGLQSRLGRPGGHAARRGGGSGICQGDCQHPGNQFPGPEPALKINGRAAQAAVEYVHSSGEDIAHG